MDRIKSEPKTTSTETHRVLSVILIHTLYIGTCICTQHTKQQMLKVLTKALIDEETWWPGPFIGSCNRIFWPSRPAEWSDSLLIMLLINCVHGHGSLVQQDCLAYCGGGEKLSAPPQSLTSNTAIDNINCLRV